MAKIITPYPRGSLFVSAPAGRGRTTKLRRGLAISTAAWFGLLGGPVPAGPYYGQSYALVVGIDDYRGGGWPRLAYARRDAEAVAALLQDRGFTVTGLYDAQANKTAIISALQTHLAPRLAADDRVLVFFAGHGHTERLGEQDFGYLVPYDGTNDSATYLSMEELRTLSEKMGRAKHQLFVLNACYGGLFAQRLRGLARSAVDTRAPGYLDQVTRRAARQFITAGGTDQQVLDGGPGNLSYFTYYLLEALGDKRLGDLDGDGAITFPELAGYLVPRATNDYQTPLVGALPGHGGGEFVFFNDAATASVVQPGPDLRIAQRHVRDGATPVVSSSSEPRYTETSLLDWFGQHLWDVFSGIGTAAVIGLLGWLTARRRQGKIRTTTQGTNEPQIGEQPATSQTAIGGSAAHNIVTIGGGNTGHDTSIELPRDGPKFVEGLSARIANLAAKLDELHADQRKREVIAGEVSLPRLISALRSAQAHAETRVFREQAQINSTGVSTINQALCEASTLANAILSESNLTLDDKETLLSNACELRVRVETVRRQVIP